MGLNQNHLMEELGGTRCSIVEKNITPERADFLTKILSGNGYTVVCVEAAPPKAKAAAAPANADQANGEVTEPAPIPATETPATTLYTLGVTDLMFNPINAIYGRVLTDEKGHFITPDYWQQKDSINNDQIPYYEKK